MAELPTTVAVEPEVSNTAAAQTDSSTPPATESKWFRWRSDGKALIAYLLDSEVHTYAFSVAANAILSFIPFCVLLYTIAFRVFHSDTMVKVVDQMVNYFLPSTADREFLPRNILIAARSTSAGGVRVFSLVMILIACTGIFLPLEVALNQAWGVSKSRNYLWNQTIALGLALVMVVLGVGSLFLNFAAEKILWVISFGHPDYFFFYWLGYSWMAVTTGVASIVFFFAIYWLLPNRRVPWRPVLRTSVITGIIWLFSKLIFVAVLPHMDLESLYGSFYISVGLLFWAYVSGLIMFAGAQFSVAHLGAVDKQPEE